ncbi:ATP-binding protein [bacterium]|nr:ATP-binding protein [bacterium]
MAFSRFRILLGVRLAGIALTLFLCFYLYFATEYRVTLVLGLLLIVWQFFGLAHYVERTERDTARFLSAIRHEDFFETFGSKRSPSAKELHDSFARVMRDFRRVRAEREMQYQYLQTVVQHIGTGLMAFDRAGNVDLVNNAARKLLRRNKVHHLEDLAPLGEDFISGLKELKPGQQQTFKLEPNGDTVQLAIYATEFRREGNAYTLISLQNIQRELEETQMQAWQDMTRVLTHEIRNSITPIASLASTTRGLLGEQEGEGIEAEEAEDARLAVSTIERRSQSLLRFVESFRRLSHIPKPRIRIVPVRDLVGHIEHVYTAQLAEKGIEAVFEVDPETLEVGADPELIEQVLINLVLNAIQAMDGREGSRLEVRGRIGDRGRVTVEIIDNGPGIRDDMRDKVFIPFFTTKKEGSGIGLAFCRQIMRLHGGALTLQSEPDRRTVFALVF